MERKVDDIRQDYAARTGDIFSDYWAAIDGIRAQTNPESGEYLDRLSGPQKFALLRDQKQEQAAAVHAKARKSYMAATEGYHAELAERRGELQPRLFGLEGSEAASTLSRAALASEDELTVLMDIAATTGNKELAKAAFVVADRRDRGDVVARYFDEVDPDARELYSEWRGLPDEEVIARQAENVERIIPQPVNLMPEPATSAYQS